MEKLIQWMKRMAARAKRISGYILKPFLEWKSIGRARTRARYTRYYKTLAVKEKTVLYESFFGRGMACSPYALFRAMLQDTRYDGYTHIWVLDEFENHTATMQEYSSRKNVIFIKYQSREYLKCLTTAQILINNVSFHDYFVKKENQIYINTWHGIPLKHLGRDMPDGAVTISNVSRTFLQSDYLLSANQFLTSIYMNSYHIKEIYSGRILEEGYPRNDTLFSDRGYVLDKLKRNGVKIDPNKKIILYAPTWRGTDFGKPQDDVEDILRFRSQLMSQIDTSKYQILVKPHNALHALFRKAAAGDFVVPASFDANEMMSQTDILISDFSSIYFDFLTTRRPVLFYIPDEAEYKAERGFYFGLDQLPAPYTEDPRQIADWINHIEAFQEQNREQYEAVRDFCENTDKSHISAHVLDIILHGKQPDHPVSVRTGKKRILIFKGAPLLNGVGASAYNLLNQIDYDKYDVTLHMYHPTNEEQRNYINGIHRNCRVLIKVGTFSATLWEQVRLNLANEYCYSYAPVRAVMPDKAYAREVQRCFGNSTFDYVVDFDGYSRMMDLLALQVPAKKRFIWQHSDMEKECTLRSPWLKHTFSLYSKFDGMVGCAKANMEVNRKQLATPATRDKFTYATNLFDASRIQSLVEQSEYAIVEEQAYFLGESSKNTPVLIPLQPIDSNSTEHTMTLAGETDAPIRLAANSTWRNGVMEISYPNFDVTSKFVTVGRCSPEKNHMALIDGFELLLKEYPNAMLYVIGNGPTYTKEYNYILNKKLEHRIIMTGNLKNPFGLMQKCDCFILPSLHEGQPISILEARMLNMPIIMSDFSSVQSSMMENGQLVIGTEKEDIYNGMKEFILGNVPYDYEFDVAQYNARCYAEFEGLFCESKAKEGA